MDQFAEDRPLIMGVRRRFADVVGDGKPLYTTTAANLYDLFLANLSDRPFEGGKSLRDVYKCNACRSFVKHYGNLVALSEKGAPVPIFWHAHLVPEPFQLAVGKLYQAVQSAKINGVFLSEEREWGTAQNTDPVTGITWNHLHVNPPEGLLYKPKLTSTTERDMAELREEYGMLLRVVMEFSPEIVRTAINLLDADTFQWGKEKVIDRARWFLDVMERMQHVSAQENFLWAEVAKAPSAFVRLRGSALGIILKGLKDGEPLHEIKRKFESAMDPNNYMVAQAAPSRGNIMQATKIIDALNAAGALKRRFANLEDLQLLWRPSSHVPKPPAPVEGVFSHLQPKGSPPREPNGRFATYLEPGARKMTWKKFQTEVLPNALQIEYQVPNGRGAYIALITAEDPDSEPVVQWDSADNRNPVTWYRPEPAAPASAWNLTPGAWVKVTAVSLRPHMWQGSFSNHREGAILYLEGAKDTRFTPHVGGGLFPEHLKSDFHSVRSTIEAHFAGAVVEGRDTATGFGVDISHSEPGDWHHTLRVTTKDGVQTAKLDRWD